MAGGTTSLRAWGTANPRYWANVDPGRSAKRVGFVLDPGKAVCPIVTPEDPDGFDPALRSHADWGTPPRTAASGPDV